MVIMSDMESFGWKLSTILFGIFGIVMTALYANVSNVDPKVVYIEPDTVFVTDTLVVHDTVLKWKEPVIADESVNVSVDTERVEQ